MEHKKSLQRVQRSAEHIGDMFEEISWAFADAFDVAIKSMTRFIKAGRQQK